MLWNAVWRCIVILHPVDVMECGVALYLYFMLWMLWNEVWHCIVIIHSNVKVSFWPSRIGTTGAYFLAVSACPLSVRLSAFISATTTEEFSTKFDTGDFHENLSCKSKLYRNQAKISDFSHEDLKTFYFFLRHQLAMKGLSATQIVSDC